VITQPQLAQHSFPTDDPSLRDRTLIAVAWRCLGRRNRLELEREALQGHDLLSAVGLDKLLCCALSRPLFEQGLCGGAFCCDSSRMFFPAQVRLPSLSPHSPRLLLRAPVDKHFGSANFELVTVHPNRACRPSLHVLCNLFPAVFACGLQIRAQERLPLDCAEARPAEGGTQTSDNEQ